VGGPGRGKSTFSLGLCHALKLAGLPAEFVPEVIKHEVFTPAGVARVVSGRHDFRYLRAQHALTQGMIQGRAPVIINDGPLEPFDVYAASRVPEPQLGVFRQLLERFRQQQSVAERRFVTLDLPLAYEASGRHQDQATARALHDTLLSALSSRFGIQPVVLSSQSQVDAYVRATVEEVRNRLATPTPRRASP
jgi:hypothetical protein